MTVEYNWAEMKMKNTTELKWNNLIVTVEYNSWAEMK